MMARSSVLNSKTQDSRSEQKIFILPKSVQGKSPSPTSTVDKQFGRLSCLSLAPPWQWLEEFLGAVGGKAEMLHCPGNPSQPRS